jgi:hypothetical protein
MQCVLGEKLAASILEFADVGRAAKDASFAGGPIQTPLASLGIVKTQGQTFNVSMRAFALELI